MSLIDLIANDGYIVTNKTLARAVGINGAVLFGELASRYCLNRNNGNLRDDGSFFATLESIEEATTLSRKVQDTAIAKLEDVGLIRCTREGLPAKRYFYLNESKLSDVLGQTCLSDRGKLDCPKGTNWIVQKGQVNNNKEDNNNGNNTNIIAPSLFEKGDDFSLEGEKYEEIFIQFPVVGGKFVPIPVSWVDEMQDTYPGINVKQEVKQAIAWCKSNPERMKTERGWKRFLNTWLNNAQNDHGGRDQSQKPKHRFNHTATNEEIDAAINNIENDPLPWIY